MRGEHFTAVCCQSLTVELIIFSMRHKDAELSDDPSFPVNVQETVIYLLPSKVKARCGSVIRSSAAITLCPDCWVILA